MSLLAYWGTLAAPEAQKMLSQAQNNPESWTVALIPENGKMRTQAQNRLYHFLLRQLTQTQGRTIRYWNDFLAEKFLGFQEVLGEDGYTRKVRSSTSELTVAEFSRFLSACMAWAAENNLG